MLDSMGKLLENLIKHRLEGELATKMGLSMNQYGFRSGRSTTQAVQHVMRVVEEAAAGTHRTRRIPVVLLLDIANAFNSIPWGIIMRRLREIEISPYVRKMIAAYLSDRTIFAGDEVYQVTCGVPQGSILGPTLWNVGYDSVLRQDWPASVTPVAFADDLALVITAREEEELESLGNEALLVQDH